MTLNNTQSSLAFRHPWAKRKSGCPLLPYPKKKLVFLQCFSLLCLKVVVASSFFSILHLLVHHAVYLEDLFESSNNSDAPIP
jgi:hypothetical protein